MCKAKGHYFGSGIEDKCNFCSGKSGWKPKFVGKAKYSPIVGQIKLTQLETISYELDLRNWAFEQPEKTDRKPASSWKREPEEGTSKFRVNEFFNLKE